MSKNKSKKVIVRVNKTPFKNESDLTIKNIHDIPPLQNGDKILIEGTEYGNKIKGMHKDRHTDTYIFKERTPLASGGHREESYHVPCGSTQNTIPDILNLKKLGLKQDEIAERLNVSQSFVSVILNKYYY
ncbi:helix-turn-helix transcriptional regulator [Clostridium botulinum C]|uniref:helix-turn-helix domain-containing protein n=1 Tax=Clostridium botulinum TaxID=1491 RepID=UPI001E36A7DE|nr:helix-turn-helix transcriptional regulator [Clostridium botulinum]MCD3245341.1 helix-turn-helix transcriptional regulator [Clostridium botulinum C]MCD3261720.1 helix-turn-helix transcriptional regulator [Clostridium botulinum C]